MPRSYFQKSVGICTSLLAMMSFVLLAEETSATGGFRVRLEASQAKGGVIVQTDQGKPAVLFQAASPIKDRIVWALERPLPAGLWRIGLDFYQVPQSKFSPDQALLIEGEGGAVLGCLNLNYIGYTHGSFTRSVGFYSDKPLKQLVLQKGGQRNLDTVAVSAVSLSPANVSELKGLQMGFHLPANGQEISFPIPLPTGVFIVNTDKPVALRWNLPDGRSFTSPKSSEIRVFLDQPAKSVVTEGEPVSDFRAACFPPAESPSMVVDGNPPLTVVTDLAKIETHTLVLKGYRGNGIPKLDLLPGGKTVAIMTSWDDGRLADLTVAEALKRNGFKGTFFMNRNSEIIRRMPELEALGMEIGSHSWSHPMLSISSPKRCLDEMVEMRRFLEKELGHPVISFAYPFSYQAAYDADGDFVMRAVQQSGYWSARNSNSGDNRIDGIPDPMNMRSNFHFKAGATKIAAKLHELLQSPGSILYFWGHSFELAGDGAKTLDNVLSAVGNREDAWYATLGELMVWQYMRNHIQIEMAVSAPEGLAFTLKMPWLHPYLRQVPVSLKLPDEVTEVSWNGQSVPVVNGRVQLKW